jgi:hypothetical protein
MRSQKHVRAALEANSGAAAERHCLAAMACEVAVKQQGR